MVPWQLLEPKTGHTAPVIAGCISKIENKVGKHADNTHRKSIIEYELVTAEGLSHMPSVNILQVLKLLHDRWQCGECKHEQGSTSGLPCNSQTKPYWNLASQSPPSHIVWKSFGILPLVRVFSAAHRPKRGPRAGWTYAPLSHFGHSHSMSKLWFMRSGIAI